MANLHKDNGVLIEIGFPKIEDLNELIEATANGDRAAFARLYRASSAKLYAMALRILKHEGSAER